MPSHFLFVLLVICLGLVTSIKAQQKDRTCSPLSSYRHVEVNCALKSERSRSSGRNDCTRPQPSGTVATYKCQAYYKALEVKGQSIDQEIRCNEKGEWVGLRRYESFRCREDCGKLVANAKPLVINGVPSNRTLWPWHATIFKKDGTGWRYICGGSLIRNQMVLTAAHCFVPDQAKAAEVGDYRVVLGAVSSVYLENIVDTGAQIHGVQRIRVSESYDAKSGYLGDISVVQLKDNVEFNENIIPVCLPSDYNTDVNAVKTGIEGQVAGFGVTEEGKVSRTLRSVQLSVRSNSECYNSLQRVLSESQFCAGSKTGDRWITLCNGDSGGGICFPSAVHEKYYIHGLVSSGDPNTNKGVCQNFAVFTRIYPFIFWIRDVIEEISGEIARDLHQAVPYPFAMRGTETNFVRFRELPREWENRVTSLEILYATIEPEIVLESLEYGRPLTSLNFSNVILEGNELFESRVVLPVLTSFHLDIIREDFQLIDRTFPIQITESFLTSFLFFDKSFDSNPNGTTLIPPNVNIDFTMHLFKLVHISNTRGEVFLQQIPFAMRILDEIKQNSEFVLRNLALHRSPLDLSTIESGALTALTLDEVELINSENDLSSEIKRLFQLKYLTLSPVVRGRNMPIRLSDLSPYLIHMSLSKGLELTGEKAYGIRVVNAKKQFGFSNMETFCCDFCNLENAVLIKFDQLFPNLQSIFLRTDQELEMEAILNMKNLKAIYLESPEGTNLQNFRGLSRMARSIGSNAAFLERSSGSWKILKASENLKQHVAFSCSGQKYFWTSEEDYMVLRRLKSFEKSAILTNIYNFTGTPTAQGLEQFKGIPMEVRHGLESIILKSVDATPWNLYNSVSQSRRLGTVVLQNVTIDFGSHKYELIENQKVELRLQKFKLLDFELDLVYEYINGKLIAANIPFQHLGRFSVTNSSNVLERLITDLNCVRLQYNACSVYILDTALSEVRTFNTHLLKMIDTLPPSHPLQIMGLHLKNLHATYREGILPPEWKFSGLHVIDRDLVEGFFKDDLLRIIGNLGILEYLLKRFGKLVTIQRSTSLSLLKKDKNPLAFPPIQAISVNINEEKVE